MSIYLASIRDIARKQIKSFDEIKGDLVSTTEISGGVILVFGDGRWVWLNYYTWPEGGGGISVQAYPADENDLQRAGLITQDQYDENEKLMKAAYSEDQEIKELELYEKLKQKYGGGSG